MCVCMCVCVTGEGESLYYIQYIGCFSMCALLIKMVSVMYSVYNLTVCTLRICHVSCSVVSLVLINLWIECC